MNIEWSIEKTVRVRNLITNFIERYEVSCADSVIQCDEPYIDSVNVMAKIVDIVMGDVDLDEE